jgi:CheY-like chemotaxis protein
MRALSIKQPWAELIALGRKRIEYRTWKGDHRGPLLVVASTARQDEKCRENGLDPAALPYGKAVCVVDVVSVTGDDGNYEWHLRNPRRVAPVAIRGSAAIFNVEDSKIRYEAPEPPPPPKRQPPRTPSKAPPAPVEVPCEDVILVVAREPGRVAELAMWAAEAAPECDVLVAFDGKRAIAALERLPRLIVTEAVLPKASGLEILARARAHVFARNGKILLLADNLGTAGFQADVVVESGVGRAAFVRAVKKLVSKS